MVGWSEKIIEIQNLAYDEQNNISNKLPQRNVPHGWKIIHEWN